MDMEVTGLKKAVMQGIYWECMCNRLLKCL